MFSLFRFISYINFIQNSFWFVLHTLSLLTLEGIRGGRGEEWGLVDFHFLFLDRLPKALAALFFFCWDIFDPNFKSNVKIDEVIIITHATCVLTKKVQFLAKKATIFI